MPGSGKTTIKEFIQNMDYSVIAMGDVIREEAKKRGLKPNAKNLGRIMILLREEEGPEIVAKRCVKKIQVSEQRVLVIDGLRSLSEVEEFRKHFAGFTIIGIHASPKTRFNRLLSRKRSDDPISWNNFAVRDMRELKVGLGNVFAISDQIIINEGTKDDLKKRLHKVMMELIF